LPKGILLLLQGSFDRTVQDPSPVTVAEGISYIRQERYGGNSSVALLRFSWGGRVGPFGYQQFRTPSAPRRDHLIHPLPL